MERALRTTRAWALTAIATVPLSVLSSGCGEEDDYANEARPPTPIVVSAAITDGRVSVSPRQFGAGPVTLIVTNQTQRAQEVTLETDEIGGASGGIKQTSGPINPGDTASLKAELDRGTYRVGVGGGGDSASLRVGASRPSAQDELLQP
jgi:hypothetical protein